MQHDLIVVRRHGAGLAVVVGRECVVVIEVTTRNTVERIAAHPCSALLGLQGHPLAAVESLVLRRHVGAVVGLLARQCRDSALRLGDLVSAAICRAVGLIAAAVDHCLLLLVERRIQNERLAACRTARIVGVHRICYPQSRMVHRIVAHRIVAPVRSVSLRGVIGYQFDALGIRLYHGAVGIRCGQLRPRLAESRCSRGRARRRRGVGPPSSVATQSSFSPCYSSYLNSISICCISNFYSIVTFACRSYIRLLNNY